MRTNWFLRFGGQVASVTQDIDGKPTFGFPRIQLGVTPGSSIQPDAPHSEFNSLVTFKGLGTIDHTDNKGFKTLKDVVGTLQLAHVKIPLACYVILTPN